MRHGIPKTATHMALMDSGVMYLCARCANAVRHVPVYTLEGVEVGR